MTRRTQGNHVADYVCIILIAIIAPRVNMMNVQRPPTWTMSKSTMLTYSVSLQDQLSYSRPMASVRTACAPSPMWRTLSNHTCFLTASRTEPTLRNYTPKNAERFATMLARNKRRRNLTFIVAFAGTVFPPSVFRKETLAAKGTEYLRCSPQPPFDMTSSSAEHIGCSLASPRWLSQKCFTAVRTYSTFLFSDRINRTFSGAVIDSLLIRFELLPTLETRFEHSQSPFQFQ